MTVGIDITVDLGKEVDPSVLRIQAIYLRRGCAFGLRLLLDYRLFGVEIVVNVGSFPDFRRFPDFRDVLNFRSILIFRIDTAYGL